MNTYFFLSILCIYQTKEKFEESFSNVEQVSNEENNGVISVPVNVL
jgi:hypothetical protein